MPRSGTEVRSSSSVLRGRETPACLRSEEHTSELQSQSNLVCRLLLEKKKNKGKIPVSQSHRNGTGSGLAYGDRLSPAGTYRAIQVERHDVGQRVTSDTYCHTNLCTCN